VRHSGKPVQAIELDRRVASYCDGPFNYLSIYESCANAGYLFISRLHRMVRCSGHPWVPNTERGRRLLERRVDQSLAHEARGDYGRYGPFGSPQPHVGIG
jgi:hypothetical protein